MDGAGRLEGLDGIHVADGQADFVESFEEAVFGERVDIEARPQAIGVNGLVGQVDGNDCARVGGGQLDQPPHLARGEDHREEADLGAVVVEDVGERRGDDGLETPILDTPRGVLAG